MTSAQGDRIQCLLTQAAQPLVRVNHVGIAVPNVADALAWYTDKMGFHEVIRQTDPMGKLTSVYLQISRDTFIEIAEAKAGTTPGITHWGLQVENIKDAVSTFRQRGAMVSNPSFDPLAWTRSIRPVIALTRSTTPSSSSPPACA